MSGSVSFDNLSSLMRTSESFGDLNAELNPLRAGPRGAPAASAAANPVPTNSASNKTSSEDNNTGSTGATNKPFGLGNCKT